MTPGRPTNPSIPPAEPTGRSRVSSSFRDPAGFVYERDGRLLRQVNRSFADEWHAFNASGLRAQLANARLLIDHREVAADLAWDDGAAAVIEPELVELISFPWEWSFSQLRDAALVTLEAQQRADAAGFTLRDASAFNVQFLCGRPILIDSLSFEPATPDEPWLPYRQFCEQFLAPLALMSRRDERLSLILRSMPDGIPLDLATKLLPARTRLSPGLATHLHLHAGAQRRSAAGTPPEGRRTARLSATGRRALIDHLRRTIEGLPAPRATTRWNAYPDASSYTPEALETKERIVRDMLTQANGRWVWDIGANRGRFSRAAAELGYQIVAIDSDASSMDAFYRELRSSGEERILPLVVDIANPSPGVGWVLADYPSLLDRCNADVIVALALVHQLAISRNVPFERISALFASMADWLIIEWIPKTDPMVAGMLAHREDIFGGYEEEAMLEAFRAHFEISRREQVEDRGRVIFLMKRRSQNANAG